MLTWGLCSHEQCPKSSHEKLMPSPGQCDPLRQPGTQTQPSAEPPLLCWSSWGPLPRSHQWGWLSVSTARITLRAHNSCPRVKKNAMCTLVESEVQGWQARIWTQSAWLQHPSSQLLCWAACRCMLLLYYLKNQVRQASMKTANSTSCYHIM